MELVNINSVASQGTTTPTSGGGACHSTNANGYCLNFGFLGGCSDTIFYERLTIAPATGDVSTGAYWASSTHGRHAGAHGNVPNGFALSTEGYQNWFPLYAPPAPPAVSYRRRLSEAPKSQSELHSERLDIIRHDPWLQGIVNRETHRVSNYTILSKLEEWEANGHRVWDRYKHATSDMMGRAINFPPKQRMLTDTLVPGAKRRRAQIVYNYSPPPPPPSTPPPSKPPQWIPENHGRPEYNVVKQSYGDVIASMAQSFDDHVVNRKYNTTVMQLDGNTYRVIMDLTNDAAANATATGLSQAFIDHLRSKTGLELTVDNQVMRGWRTMCNGSVAPPPPPMATWEILENCAPTSSLITSDDECEEAATFLGHNFMQSWGGTGCQMFGNTLVWGGASTDAEYGACGVVACVLANGGDSGCDDLRCACRITSPSNPNYVVV